MNIVFLCKRRPMARDLTERPYGRFHYLPRELADRGHRIVNVLLSYKYEAAVRHDRDGMTWISKSIFHGGPMGYYRLVDRVVQQEEPDWIGGFSDTFYAILAVHFGRKYGVRTVVDAYDNYESYIPWCTPLHGLYRRALSRATAVTAAGPGLAAYMGRHRNGRNVHIVPMAADPVGFAEQNQADCRRRLRLPLDAKLVGYCGSINRNRGMDVAFRALETLVQGNHRVQVVACGRVEKGIQLPTFVRHMGYIPDDRVPTFINSVDVLLVLSRLNRFGRFSYPVKLYEAMACGIPVVATRTPGTEWALGRQPAFLADHGDPMDLERKINAMLERGRINYGTLTSWPASARKFENALARDLDPGQSD